jgi:hypothetical protein
MDLVKLLVLRAKLFLRHRQLLYCDTELPNELEIRIRRDCGTLEVHEPRDPLT